MHRLADSQLLKRPEWRPNGKTGAWRGKKAERERYKQMKNQFVDYA